MARIAVTRTLVFEGDEQWVRDTLSRSWLSPDRPPALDTGPDQPSHYVCARELARSEEPIPDQETAEERAARWGRS